MTHTKDEAMKLALEALETSPTKIGTKQFEIEVEAMVALSEALAQPAQQEPFQPDWANFEEGRKVGRAEALEYPPNCGTNHCSCIECFKLVHKKVNG